MRDTVRRCRKLAWGPNSRQKKEHPSQVEICALPNTLHNEKARTMCGGPGLC